MRRTGYELANQTAYLDDMLRWGLDWMIKVSLSAFRAAQFWPDVVAGHCRARLMKLMD